MGVSFSMARHRFFWSGFKGTPTGGGVPYFITHPNGWTESLGFGTILHLYTVYT